MRATLLSTLVLCGCAITVDRTIHTRGFEDSPVATGSVQVYLSGDVIDERCARVADIHVEANRPSRLWQLIGRIREEAGKLGANAVQVLTMEEPGFSEELALALIGEDGDIDSDAVALHCPAR